MDYKPPGTDAVTDCTVGVRGAEGREMRGEAGAEEGDWENSSSS